MARRWTFGTDSFGTLVTALSPHLLDSKQLQVAENVSRDVAGQLSPSATDLTIHTTGVDIYGMRVVRYGGSTHVIYASPYYLFVDGVQIGESGGPVTHRFVCDGERVYIFDGVQPKVWDGSNLRNLGALSRTITEYPTLDYGVWNESTSANYPITVISKADPCEITVSAAHGLSAGDHVYINAGDMTELTTGAYIVGSVPSTTKITIQNVGGNDIDSTAYTTYTTGGTVLPHPCNYTHTVKMYVTYVAVMADGLEIESSPQQVPFKDPAGSAAPVWTARAPTSGAYQVYAFVPRFKDSDIEAYAPSLTTAQRDAFKIRLYRNVSGGADLWMVGELTGTTVHDGSGSQVTVYDKSYGDDGVGAEFLDTNDAHGSPPLADLAVFCNRRLYVAIKGGRTLHFSGIDQYDYFKPTDNVDAEETIYGLSTIGGKVAVVTPTSIRPWDHSDAVGGWSGNASTVGTVYTDSIAITEMGLLFARQDGLYLCDGVSSRRVSASIDPTWQEFDSPNSMWRGAYSNGFGYFTNGIVAVEFKLLGGSFEWSTSDAVQSNQAVGHLSDDPLDSGVWSGHLDGTIRHMHQGTGLNTMTVKTKDFGDGATRKWDRITVDFSGSLSAVVATNRGATQTVALSSTGRLRDREMLLATMIGELANVTFTGTGTLHGVELETT